MLAITVAAYAAFLIRISYLFIRLRVVCTTRPNRPG
jgi:hypothetical protein